MTTMRIISLILMLSIAQYPAAAGDTMAIVTATGNPIDTLSIDTLKLIYLRKSQIDPHGNRWIPVNLPITDSLRHDFSLALFSIPPEEQEDYWNAQYFHGITPPTVMTSEEAVIRFVSSTPGSIGYVRKPKADNRVKILQLINPGGTK